MGNVSIVIPREWGIGQTWEWSPPAAMSLICRLLRRQLLGYTGSSRGCLVFVRGDAERMTENPGNQELSVQKTLKRMG